MITDLTTTALRFKKLINLIYRPVQERSTNQEGVIVGHTLQGLPVFWPLPSFEKASHTAILAASGGGKTILTALSILKELQINLSCESIQDSHDLETSFLIIDPKGDLVSALLSGLCASCPQHLEKTFYLNPFQERGFPFNLIKLQIKKTSTDILATQLAELCAVVSTARGSQAHLGVGARQIDALEHLILAALTCLHDGASLLWALDALYEPKGLVKLASLTQSPRARQFLLSSPFSEELKASTAARLRGAFSATDQLSRLISAPSCLCFSELLSPGNLVLITLQEPPGGLISLQTLWANLLFRMAVESLLSRTSPWKGHHVRVVLDEAQVMAPVLSDVAETILTTGRSKGISLTVLSQGTALLKDASDTLLKVLLTNTPTRFIGRLAAPDAELLAKELSPGPGIDESLKEIRNRFVSSVTNLKERNFYLLSPGSRQRFVSETVDLESWKRAYEKNSEELSELKTRLSLASSSSNVRMTLSQAVEESEKKKAKQHHQKVKSSSVAQKRWG